MRVDASLPSFLHLSSPDPLDENVIDLQGRGGDGLVGDSAGKDNLPPRSNLLWKYMYCCSLQMMYFMYLVLGRQGKSRSWFHLILPTWSLLDATRRRPARQLQPYQTALLELGYLPIEFLLQHISVRSGRSSTEQQV